MSLSEWSQQCQRLASWVTGNLTLAPKRCPRGGGHPESSQQHAGSFYQRSEVWDLRASRKKRGSKKMKESREEARGWRAARSPRSHLEALSTIRVSENCLSSGSWVSVPKLNVVIPEAERQGFQCPELAEGLAHSQGWDSIPKDWTKTLTLEYSSPLLPAAKHGRKLKLPKTRVWRVSVKVNTINLIGFRIG